MADTTLFRTTSHFGTYYACVLRGLGILKELLHQIMCHATFARVFQYNIPGKNEQLQKAELQSLCKGCCNKSFARHDRKVLPLAIFRAKSVGKSLHKRYF